MVIDGTGAPLRRADVLIVGDRIVLVRDPSDGDGDAVAAREVIDARDLVVAPGLIDVHAHGDPLRAPKFENFLAMGVTTICLGLDGSSPWRDDPAAWFDAVDQRRPGVNIAAFVGHGSVRRTVMGNDDAPADGPQRSAMAAVIEAALDAGAAGLSTGLEYTPGRFADATELRAIAEPVGARGAIVASHVRNEDDDAIESSVVELLAQCESTGAGAHLSHAKIVFARDPTRADAVRTLMSAARSRGVRVTGDVYPYVASYTGLSILFPEWALEPNDYAEVVRARRDELASHLRHRVTARNGPDATLFGSGPYAGTTLAEVAEDRGESFEDVLIALGPNGASAAYFVMSEAVMERLLIDPFVMVASDGSPTMRHPRGHGTFARILSTQVRERHLLTLEDAIHKMTALPADTFGLVDRGRIAEGSFADLVVFDPRQVTDHATFQEPFARATGFTHVLIGGRFAVRDGSISADRNGHALRRRP